MVGQQKPGPKAKIAVDPLTFDDAPPRGWRRVVWFAETYLKVPRGVGAKGPFVLRPWQVDIVKQMLPDEGRPRQGLISLPRGNGKTGLAAVLAVYALFADEEESAQVLIVASDERQAGHVLRAAARMIETSPELAARTHVYSDRIRVPQTDSEMRALPADEGALQGWDPSLMIVDELHVVTEKVWDAVTTAMGKRPESLVLAISTPANSTDSIMWRLVEAGRAGTLGESFVYVEYSATPGCDLNDEEEWHAANPALGDFLAVDAIRAQVRTIREEQFRRYRLGQWVGSENAWLPQGAWRAQARPRVVGRREPVVMMFDGSTSGDSTVLVGCVIPKRGEKPYVFEIGMWEAPKGSDVAARNWRVPRAEVSKAVDDAFARYAIKEFACDPWGWQSEIQGWAEKHGKARVVEYNTAFRQRMAPATDLMYEAVMEGQVENDGSPRMAVHFDNAVAVSSPQGDIIHKDRAARGRKIDSAVAAIVAFQRAVHYSTRSARSRSFAS